MLSSVFMQQVHDTCLNAFVFVLDVLNNVHQTC